MISDDERREVAKRLRNGGVARNSEEAYVLLLSRIGIRPQLPATNTYEDAMARLADLIDRPTCEMKSIPGSSYRVCSRCGAFVRRDAVTNCTEAIPVRFCPNCDARVVSETATREPYYGTGEPGTIAAGRVTDGLRSEGGEWR